MGWNCMECGELLIPEGYMGVKSKAGDLNVQHNKCPKCGAECITVFRSKGHKDNYLGSVKIWPDSMEAV